MKNVLRRLWREPLLHFLALGALLFAIYGWMNGGNTGGSESREIVVSRGQVDSLKAQFERVWQRQPNAEELKGVIDGWVREEVMVREGLAMGLDRDDLVVRRRVVQKIEFLADGAAAGVAAPSEAQLQAWLAQHAADYQLDPVYTLAQVYFDPSRRGGEQLDADVSAARRALQDGKKAKGDSTMLPASMDKAPASEVSRIFGDEFELQLRALPVGAGWSEPVRSGFGLHLVQLSAREPGRPATLADVRAAVERDWLRDRAEAAKQDFYAKARANYTVRIEGSDAP